MSIQCPYRHTPYSIWRLQVIRTLCGSVAQQSRPSILLTCPRSSAKSKRTFHNFRPFGVNETSAADPVKDGTPQKTELSAKEEVSSSHKKPLRSHRKNTFNPYSSEGREKIKNLLSQLRPAVERAQHRAANVSENDAGPQGPSPLPRTPILRRTGPKYMGPKRRPTWPELDALKHNVWAQMLAAPVRACEGSGARLPSPFHTDLGFVEKPEKEQVYVSPIYLADLAALEKKMAREVYEEDWRRVRDDKRAAQERRARGEETQSIPSGRTNKVKELPRSRILSDMNLFRLLTLSFMERSKRRGSKEIVTKPGHVMRLVPTPVREAMSKAQHYALNKRMVDIATGVCSDDDSPKLHEHYLKQLQWQEDVHERIARIMRKRILLALRALAEQAVDDFRNAKEVKVLALPTNTDTDKADSAARRPECPSGSILLHIGGGDTSSLVSSIAASADTPSGSPGLDGGSPSLPSNPLLPPMVSLDGTHRIPVFPLTRMLASHDADSPELSALADLVAKHTVLQHPNSQTEQSDHFLLVRPGVGPPKAVVEEVWQLWRYLGGSNMGLVSDPEMEQKLVLEAEQHRETGRQNARGQEDVGAAAAVNTTFTVPRS